MWPVHGRFKWMGYYHGMVASPDAADRRLLGHLGLASPSASPWPATAFLIVAAVLGARAVAVGASWPSPPPCSAALAVAAPLTAFAATQETDHRFPLVLRFFTLPHVPVLGHVLPAQPAARAAAGRRVDLAAVARRRAVPRRPPPARCGPAGGSASLAHVAVLRRLHRRRASCGALRTFTRRLAT